MHAKFLSALVLTTATALTAATPSFAASVSDDEEPGAPPAANLAAQAALRHDAIEAKERKLKERERALEEKETELKEKVRQQQLVADEAENKRKLDELLAKEAVDGATAPRVVTPTTNTPSATIVKATVGNTVAGVYRTASGGFSFKLGKKRQ